jgi:hypothetical protein
MVGARAPAGGRRRRVAAPDGARRHRRRGSRRWSATAHDRHRDNLRWRSDTDQGPGGGGRRHRGGRGRRASTGDAVRVVIADDEALLREGLARLLQDAGFEVAGRCGDADALVRMVDTRKPDVAIVDIKMAERRRRWPAGRAGDPPPSPRRRRAGALPLPGLALRGAAARGGARGRGLSAQGPRVRGRSASCLARPWTRRSPRSSSSSACASPLTTIAVCSRSSPTCGRTSSASAWPAASGRTQLRA